MDSNDPGWQQPQGQPLQNYAGPRPTNPMAIAALVSSLVLAPLGIILGHISLSQIKRTGEDGRGLAIAGLAIGYVSTVIAAIWLIVSLAGLAVLKSAVDTSTHTTRDTTAEATVGATTGSMGGARTPTLLAPSDRDRSFADVAASICGVVTRDELSRLNGKNLPAGHEIGPSDTSRTCSYTTVSEDPPSGAGVTCHNLTADRAMLSFFTNNGVAQDGTDSSGRVQWFTTETDQFVFFTSTTICVAWRVASSSSSPSSTINSIAPRLVTG